MTCKHVLNMLFIPINSFVYKSRLVILKFGYNEKISISHLSFIISVLDSTYNEYTCITEFFLNYYLVWKFTLCIFINWNWNLYTLICLLEWILTIIFFPWLIHLYVAVWEIWGNSITGHMRVNLCHDLYHPMKMVIARIRKCY